MVDPLRSQRLVVVGLVAAAVAGTVAMRRRRHLDAFETDGDPAAERDAPVPNGAPDDGTVISVTMPPVPGAPDRSWRTAPAGGLAILDFRMVDQVRGTEVVQAEPTGEGRSVPSAVTASTASTHPDEVVPGSRHRLSGATLAAIAAAFGLAAIGTGGWAFIESVRADGAQPVSFVEKQSVAERVVSLVSKPTTERIPLQNAAGRLVLVVGAKGYGALVLDGLGHAPEGRAYQAWVERRGSQAPVSAAVFTGAESVVPLTTLVPRGATVAVTLERAGGVTAPSRTPRLTATR